MLVAGEVGVGKSMLVSTLTDTLGGGGSLGEPQRASAPGKRDEPRPCVAVTQPCSPTPASAMILTPSAAPA